MSDLGRELHAKFPECLAHCPQIGVHASLIQHFDGQEDRLIHALTDPDRSKPLELINSKRNEDDKILLADDVGPEELARTRAASARVLEREIEGLRKQRDESLDNSQIILDSCEHGPFKFDITDDVSLRHIIIICRARKRQTDKQGNAAVRHVTFWPDLFEEEIDKKQ